MVLSAVFVRVEVMAMIMLWCNFYHRDLFFFFKQKTAYEIGTGDWSSDVALPSSAIGFKRFGNEKIFFTLLYGMFF